MNYMSLNTAGNGHHHASAFTTHYPITGGNYSSNNGTVSGVSSGGFVLTSVTNSNSCPPGATIGSPVTTSSSGRAASLTNLSRIEEVSVPSFFDPSSIHHFPSPFLSHHHHHPNSVHTALSLTKTGYIFTSIRIE